MVKYRHADEIRNACLSKLRRKLEKADDTNEDPMKIINVLSGISKLLNNETSFKTN